MIDANWLDLLLWLRVDGYKKIKGCKRNAMIDPTGAPFQVHVMGTECGYNQYVYQRLEFVWYQIESKL